MFKARETGLCFLCGLHAWWRCAYQAYRRGCNIVGRVSAAPPDRNTAGVLQAGLQYRRSGKRSATRHKYRRSLKGSNPSGGDPKEKSPYFRTSSHLKYGGEGGIDSLCSPFGQPVRCALSLSNWLRQLSNPGRGFSSPLSENIKEKSPYFRTSSHLEYGGEGGIRTPDTLPYTHFPGVLLQPLGHLTILYCCLTAWGATGRYYRELR